MNICSYWQKITRSLHWASLFCSNRIRSAPTPNPAAVRLFRGTRIRSSTTSTVARLAFAALIACAPLSLHAQTAGLESGAVTLAPGDQLRLVVWGHPEFSGDYLISADGLVTHPLLKDIKAAGVPMPQLESHIKTFLGRYIADPAFVITPLVRVFVGGEVKTPATYPALPGTTIDQALLLAGGPLSTARLDSVVLVRNRQRSVLNLVDEGGGLGATAIHSGDVLLVPRIKEGSFVRDVLVPTISVLGVLTAVANLVVTLSRH